MSHRICLIFNPTAQGERAARFRARIGEIASHCTLKGTFQPGEGRKLASEAVREGFDTIVAAGGDGTVNEVVNGIGDEPDGFARVRFGVLPIGTVNVFAREMRVPPNFENAWMALQNEEERLIDLGIAEYVENGEAKQRYFVQMAGAGFDARANSLVRWDLKKSVGVLAFFLAGLQALQGRLADITCAHGNDTFNAQVVLLGNGRLYGGSFALFPLGDHTDGLLEVTTIEKVTLVNLMRAWCGLTCNQLYGWGGARHRRVESLSLTSADPVLFHVDGENVGHLPLRFSLRKKCLRVVVPK